eukprot:2966313-Heterocapsa_arctica.AAC.1
MALTDRVTISLFVAVIVCHELLPLTSRYIYIYFRAAASYVLPQCTIDVLPCCGELCAPATHYIYMYFLASARVFARRLCASRRFATRIA